MRFNSAFKVLKDKNVELVVMFASASCEFLSLHVKTCTIVKKTRCKTKIMNLHTHTHRGLAKYGQSRVDIMRWRTQRRSG